MFDLFRFVMLRPAVALDSSDIISTTQDSDFQSQLERDRESATAAPSMERTADQFLEGKGAVLTEESLSFGEMFDGFSESLRTAKPKDRDKLLTSIKNAFGLGAVDLLKEKRFRDDRKRLVDTLIAAKLGTPRSNLPLDKIARDIRLIALIQRAADGDVRLDSPDKIQAALTANIALPEKLLPVEEPLDLSVPDNGERPPTPQEGPPDHRERREQSLREYRELTEAHDYLAGLSSNQIGDPASSTTGAAAERNADRPASHERTDPSENVLHEIRQLRDAVLSRRTVTEGPLTASIVADGLPTSSASVVQGTTLKIRREALTEAPQSVHAGLRAVNVDLTTTSISDALDRINARRRELASLVLDDLIGVSAAAGRSNVSLIGGQFIATNQIPDLVARDPRREHA